jgi:hypothetical protein
VALPGDVRQPVVRIAFRETRQIALRFTFSKDPSWAFRFLGSGTPRASHSKSRDTPRNFVPQLSLLSRPPATEQNKGVLRMAMWLT